MARMRKEAGPVGVIDTLITLRDVLPGKISLYMLDHLVESGFVVYVELEDEVAWYELTFRGYWFLYINKK